MPNGPWPNAPSEPCLPVSILVPRNALVLTNQFHLPDKSERLLIVPALFFGYPFFWTLLRVLMFHSLRPIRESRISLR